MAPFSAGVRGRSVEPVMVSRRRITCIRSSSTFDEAEERNLHQAALDREQRQVAGHVVAADHVEDQRRTPRPPVASRSTAPQSCSR